VFSRRGYFPNPRESRALALRLRAVLEAVLSLAAAVADVWNDGELGRRWARKDGTLSEIRRVLRPSGTVCPSPGPHLTDQLIGTASGGMTESIATIVGEE
jgi:hypothetical protein